MTKNNMEKRLEHLNNLLRQGLITPETYAESFDIVTQLSKEERPVPKPRQGKRPAPIKKLLWQHQSVQFRNLARNDAQCLLPGKRRLSSLTRR